MLFLNRLFACVNRINTNIVILTKNSNQRLIESLSFRDVFSVVSFLDHGPNRVTFFCA